MKTKHTLLLLAILLQSCFMGHHNAIEAAPGHKNGLIVNTLEFTLDTIAFVTNGKASDMTEAEMKNKAIAANFNGTMRWINFHNACELQTRGLDLYHCKHATCYAIICTEDSFTSYQYMH